MEKICNYERCEKPKDDDFDHLKITLYITQENEKKLEKCLDDKAFLYSLVHLLGEKEPNRLRIKVCVVNIYEKDE